MLVVADSLLDKMLALGQAFLELDTANMIVSDPDPGGRPFRPDL